MNTQGIAQRLAELKFGKKQVAKSIEIRRCNSIGEHTTERCRALQER